MTLHEHIDGTICQNRKTMPSKATIAAYWKDKVHQLFDYDFDWGEPSCWACGYWNESYPDAVDLAQGEENIFQCWNKHRYLERCHIIPKAHRGCNCAANLVLMCRDCHKESPDTNSSESFLKWVRNRKSWIYYRTQKLIEAIESMRYIVDKGDEEVILSEAFRTYFLKNAIPVGGRYASSTILACLDEFKKKKSD